jgi:small subunit ribosomal protein S11
MANEQEEKVTPATPEATPEAAPSEAPAVPAEAKPETAPEAKAAAETPTKKPGSYVQKSKGKGKRRKNVRQVASGKAFVHATYNNTIVTLTDMNGNVLAWSSAGVVGFKGPKKSTPYAAGVIVRDAVEKVEPTGLKEVACFVSGIGSGREAAVRALHANGIAVTGIKDVTPIPHNGCRPPKPRRI